MSLLLFAKKKFNPRAWFAKGEQGAWYDPSDLTTLFQDSAGITPVTAVEQPVGLMLDKSKGLALGAELVTNGDFSNGTTGWTAGSVATILNVSNRLRVTNGSAGYGYAYQAISTIVGVTYYVPPFYAVGIPVGTLNVGTTLGGSQIYSGGIASKSLYFTATATTTYISMYVGNNVSGDFTDFDNISVKQIAGNHAFQATSGNKPLLSARVNLLTKTEDFSTSPWSKGGLANTVTNVSDTNPSGATTLISKIDLPAVSGVGVFSQIYTSATVLATGNTVSMYLKGVVGGEVVYIMLTTDVVNWSSVPCTLTTSWQKFTVSRTPASSSTIYFQFGVDLRDPAQSAKPAQSFYAWGADLRPTNSGALLPAYQRVNTATDYDTVGFPLYLACNGTVSSRSMSTNSIDFTATDKMTVVTGVRKLSDAASGQIIEISINASANNGTFYFAAPNGIGGTGTGNYNFVSKGSTTQSQAYTGNISALAAPHVGVLTCISSISTDVAKLYINSIQAATSTSDQGLGNFGNYPLYLFARAGTSLFLNGQFYGAIIRGAQSDTASVTQTENYMATKTGITF